MSSETGIAPVVRKSRFADSAIWGTIACGAGLFSDGYLNAVRVIFVHFRQAVKD
jgi:hypothetical protein